MSTWVLAGRAALLKDAALLISHKRLSLVGICPFCGEYNWTKRCKTWEKSCQMTEKTACMCQWINLFKIKCLQRAIELLINTNDLIVTFLCADLPLPVLCFWNGFYDLFDFLWCHLLTSAGTSGSTDKPLALMSLSLSDGVVKMWLELYKAVTRLQMRVKFLSQHSRHVINLHVHCSCVFVVVRGSGSKCMCGWLFIS